MDIEKDEGQKRPQENPLGDPPTGTGPPLQRGYAEGKTTEEDRRRRRDGHIPRPNPSLTPYGSIFAQNGDNPEEQEGQDGNRPALYARQVEKVELVASSERGRDYQQWWFGSRAKLEKEPATMRGIQGLQGVPHKTP